MDTGPEDSDSIERVGIAELKRRLSRYVRSAREGRSITVFDRDTPVARLVPYRAEAPLSVREPRPDAPRLGDLDLPEPRPDTTDIVELLAEERGDR